MNSRKPTPGRGVRVFMLALGVALSAIGLVPGAGRAEAADGLREVLRGAAAEIVKVVKDQAVSVGQITPTGLPDANGGPAIVELLKQELERLRPGSVRRAGAFEI